MNFPNSVTFKVYASSGVEGVSILSLIQVGTNYPVLFSQDLSKLNGTSLVESGIALTKYGYLIGNLDGTVSLFATIYGKTYSGVMDSTGVVLTPVL